jgi:hypothetical protein
MSKWNYVTDSRAIIALEGLRIAEKVDTQAYGGHDVEYRLEVIYRGESRDIKYSTKEERDSTFDELSKRLKDGSAT